MAISRRKFIVGGGLVGGGLILGFSLGDNTVPYPAAIEGSFNPNAWLQITEDGQFIFQLHKTEMGQGVIGSLPTIIAEELDVDPKRFIVQHAGIHPDFSNPATGGQMTGGSASISASYSLLREAGAAARAMLIATAAARWNLDPADCRTENGEVIGSDDNRRLAYSALATEARDFTEQSYTLKTTDQFRYIGQSSTRPDALAKSTGTAEFGVDIHLPGIKTAVVVRSPHFGGKASHWDAGSIKQMSGVQSVFAIHSGIAIVADTYWQAQKAATALKVTWDKGPLAGLDSATIKQQQRDLITNEEPRWVMEEGDPSTAWDAANTIIEADYSAPFTHHSPMEPQNATALATKIDGVVNMEMWIPSQAPDLSRSVAVHFTDIATENITVNTTLMGGGFGRRGYPDFAGEVAAVAEKMLDTPIKLMWSREDDMQHDYYRASSEHRLKAALDSNGDFLAWQHTMVASSIIKTMAVSMAAQLLPSWVPASIAESLGRSGGNLIAQYDPIPSEGAKIPYKAANIAVGQIEYDSGVPTGFWRSVGFSYNVFVVESFIDEVAFAAKVDPLVFRQRYLESTSRHKTVLDLAAEKANWGQAPAGIYQGLAISEPFSSFCAMVVDISMAANGKDYTIEKVVAAVDCGIVIDPDVVEAQIEGGIIYALSAAVKDPVTFKDGATVQSNFHDLPVIRFNEIPKIIEVHIVKSDIAPTGIGEIAVPALAPALANALFSATGQRLRDMPLRLS